VDLQQSEPAPLAPADALERGRDAFERRAWGSAHRELRAADQHSPLSALDLERLAVSAYLLGNQGETGEYLARAHQEYLALGRLEDAARTAIRLTFNAHERGEFARGNGWLERARRLLEEYRADSVESGYLCVPLAQRAFHEGEPEKAHAGFVQAAAIGERFHDRDLVTMARHGQGRSLIRMDKAERGVALLDEAMAAVTAGDVSPVIAGVVYCSVIEGCHEIYDLRRAQEWTVALEEWCSSQPDLVPYRGPCLVHRAEILQLHGAWAEALEQASLARDRLSDPPGQRAIGGAHYQLGEVFRVTGRFAEADASYREAARYGRPPEPGLALLRLAQGRTTEAVGAIRRALAEAREPRRRAPLLAAGVEALLAANDVEAAATAAAELAQITERLDAAYLRAAAADARGAVLLAQDDANGALHALRTAWEGWGRLDAPYEAARARVLIGLACQALGDATTADLELDFARREFERLGAGPDLDRLRRATGKEPSARPGGLTQRELEVLVQIAAGKTNRAIAEALGISEKTVARHVSNIFTKLGLSSRTAATAYAYQHRLVTPAT
jgi:DNA-binding NarL/FixJ family response regulator